MLQLLNIIIKIALYIFSIHYLSKIVYIKYIKYCEISKASVVIKLPINQV